MVKKMKKQLMIVGIVVIFLAVGLSGCNEQEKTNGNTQTTKEVEIVSHNVERKEYSSDGSVYGYEVTGVIKNIGNRNLDQVTITVKFYDSDNELLCTKKDYVSYLAKGETDNFEVLYSNFYYIPDPYLEQYDHYAISIST